MRRYRSPEPSPGYGSDVLRVGTSSRVRTAGRTAAPLLVAALLCSWLFVDAHDRARLDTDAALRASLASSVTEVSSAFRSQLTSAPLTPGTTVPVAQVSSATVSLTSTIQARDSGSPVVDDTARPPAIVVPVYASALPPRTTAERRRSITAYRVVPLGLRPLLSPLVPDSGGLAVRGPSGADVADTGVAGHGARTFSVDLDLGGPTGWTLQGWMPQRAMAAGTWLLALGLLALFAGVSAVLTSARRHVDSSQERQAQLERDNALVSGLAPVVQASLDLGEVVPAASSHLAQGLALQGLGLSAPGPSGERPLFSWGVPPDPSVPPAATTPNRLEAGETFALSLARGGRVLGVLRVVAGTPLVATDLRALATAAELVGSTLANAEAFAQQQTLLERMQSVDELKTVFLATASHELRTPVAAIVGFSTLVLQQWGQGDPEQTKAFLERVLANARALEALTEQLLDFSRLERGIKPQAGELLDLGRTTTTVLEDQPELTSGHLLKLRVDPECLVRGSGPAVQRIVTNLVGNAAKYSPAGSAITVTVHSDNGRVVLMVDDEGPGVAAADRERVFTRFYRGREDAVVSTRGAGVGLAIVAEFAASMSGSASVQESPSGGARFCVTFPAAGVLASADNEGAPHARLA
jgi:signal transduction histidine kinase